MVDANELKKEIDSIDTNDKIEAQEMEEFLKSEENIKKLWEAMEWNTSQELIKEMENALKDVCNKFLDTKELNENQEDILLYFLNKFWDKYTEIKDKLWWICENIIKKQNINDISLKQFKILSYYISNCEPENWDDKIYKKVWAFIKKLYDNYLKDSKKWGKLEWAVAQFFEELQQEQINRINEIAEKLTEEFENETSIRGKQRIKDQERLDKLLSRRENDKKEIEELLQKEWELSEEDRQKLLYYRDFYYKEWHVLYRNNVINEEISNKLTDELWWDWHSYWIVWYDKIANEIDKKLNSGIFSKIDNIINKWELPKDISELKDISEWIKKFWKNNPEKNEKIKWMISNEIKNIINITFKNEDNDKLTKTQIWVVQLYTNIKYWENIEIDGNRWKSPFGNTKNQEITNLYIYRIQLINRESEKYTHIEKIANLDGLLNRIHNKDKRNEIFKEFLENFYLPFKTDPYWPSIENIVITTIEKKLNKWPFKEILVCLINKYIHEEYGTKDLKIPQERKNSLPEWTEVNTYAEYYEQILNTNEENLENLRKLADNIEKKRLEEEKRQELMKQANEKIKKLQSATEKLIKLKEQFIKSTSTSREMSQSMKEDVRKQFENIINIINNLPVINNLDWYNISEIRESCIQLISYFFPEDEIREYFWEKILNEYKKIYNKTLKEYTENNKEIDMIHQLETERYELRSMRYSWASWSITTDINKIKERENFQKDYYKKHWKYLINTWCKASTATESWKWNEALLLALAQSTSAWWGTQYPDGIFIQIPGCHIYNEEEWHKFTNSWWDRWVKSEWIHLKRNEISWNDFMKILDLINQAHSKKIKLYFDESVWKPISLKNFAEVKEMEWWYKLNYKWWLPKKEKIISAELIWKAKKIRENTTSILDNAEFRNNLKDLEYFNDGLTDIANAWKNFEENGLSDWERWYILRHTKEMLDKKNALKSSGTIKKLIEQIRQFSKAKDNGITSETDRKISNWITQLTRLEWLIESEEIDKNLKILCDESIFYSNDTLRKRALNRLDHNLIPTLCAVALAVWAIALAPETWWTSIVGLLYMAGFATAWWIAWSRIGTWINNLKSYIEQELHEDKYKLNFWNWEIKTYKSYDNYWTLEYFFNSCENATNWEREEAIKNFWSFIFETGSEWVKGTVTTAALMWAWVFMWKWFTAIANKPQKNVFEKMLVKMWEKIPFSHLKPPKDPYAEDLCNSIWNSIKLWKTKWDDFMDKFKREAIEESREEFIEQWSENIDPKLGMAVTLRHSLSRTWNTKIYQKTKTTIDGIWRGPNNTINIRLSYNETINENNNFNELKNHLESLWYNFDENTKQFTQKNESNPDFTNVIELIPSKQSFETRNFVSNLSSYGITMNHENWKIYYTDINSIIELKEEYSKSNKWVIDINQENGTVTITSWETTICLEKHPLVRLIEEARDSDIEEIETDNWIYFEWKPHKFNVNENMAISNSQMMDKFALEINKNNQSEKLKELRNIIDQQYNNVTHSENGLNLTDEQLLSIIEAHKQKWVLWKLEPSELRRKNEILAETIKNKDSRRFLFEAWFCGSLKLWTDHIWDIKKLNQQDIKSLIDWKLEVKIEEMTLNDLNVLMWKAANMWLDIETIWNVSEKINKRIQDIKNWWKYNEQHMKKLEENIAQISFEVKIKNIEINDSNFDSKIHEIEEEINNKFRESKIWKELKAELDKKKFEHYKVNWELLKAKLTIEEMESLNKSLLSEDITNFKYKRWLLDIELYKIQIWIGDINLMKKNAEELREDTETIWWRTDINTILSKVEAWILLWKTRKELDVYLSFLAIQEHGVWVNILWNVISTISNTFPEQELDASAKRIEDAWKASKNQDFIWKWERARKIANDYKDTKKRLEWDKKGIEMKKLQDIIDKAVYETPIKTVTDIGNTFINPLQLFNYWTVASVEITENTYTKTHEILTWSKDVNWVKIEWGIDMEGNRDPTEQGFRNYMKNINEKFDGFIRKLFSTEQLQELNSASHSSGYDANMKSYLEKVWLNDLAQVMEIYWIADCRVHAFTKQILFDTMKRTQLQNLYKKLNDSKTPAEKERIQKQIKILKNTKMVYVDSTFTWNVRMRGKYVKEDNNGHFVEWDENAIIEEHTYNLIELPTIDSEGNIIYKGWDTVKEVYYADSFYQWHLVEVKNEKWETVQWNSVYDLSYNWKVNLGNTIYGRTYYTKKNWKYVHDPKINMSMSTEVITSDWKVLPITSVPLLRSVKWRGDNLIPSNAATEVLTKEEIENRNKETRENVNAIIEMAGVKTWIQNTMLEALKNGDIGKLEEILDNWITTEICYNNVTWRREHRDWNVKIEKTQSQFLKRAINICKKYGKWNIPLNMQESLNKMIKHIVTQDEVDYRKESSENSDVEERMWIFWDSIQVFNDVYKSKIEDAIRNLDPKDKNSIQILEKAIWEYQKIYNEDMKDFLEWNKKITLKENKRNETYHRNNFKHIAERYQNDMKLYTKTFKSLENAWLFEHAYEIRAYMINQGAILLDHSDELLWHMIDFKKVKKEMKGVKWRETYNQLKEIQSKNIMNIETELKNRWLDRNHIKEMTWLDENAPLNKENLEKAIANIEESWLKKYYDTIALVFNPELLAINMENAVYSSNSIYTSETENWRIFTTETKEEYIKRMEKKSDLEKNINDNTQSEEIQKICDWIVDSAIYKIPNWNETSQIKSTISELIHFCKINGIKWKAMYDLCKISTESLIFQTIESKTRSMWDHWINHISWNIQKLNTYLKAWVKAGKIPAGEVWKYQLMWALTHIFHDIWYAAIISRWSNSFDGSQIHPFTSKVFFDSKVANILSNAKINTDLIWKAIESHDGIRLNWGSPETAFLSMVNLSDNMALWVDKIAEIWSNPHLLRHLATLYALDAAWLDIKKIHETMIEEINKDPDLNENQKETLKSAIKEISTFSMSNVDFRSISPLTSMEFNWKAPTLSMFQWANIMLVTEVCGINKVELEQAIKNKDRNAIIKIMEWPDWKWTKFCSQIIKPLDDYSKIYTIHDAKWNEYEKIDWEYNRNNIKADLLLGETLTLKDWNSEVLNYRYELATDKSILAEQNSVYGSIDMKEMLWEWVEARNKLQAKETISELWTIYTTLDDMKKEIKDKKDISTNSTKVNSAISTLFSITSTTWSAEFNSKYKNIKTELASLQTYLESENYDYNELSKKIESIQNKINDLLPTLIQ